MKEDLPTPLVETSSVLRSRRRAEFAAERQRLVSFSGPSGAGKTTSADDVAEWLSQNGQLHVVQLTIPVRPAPREVSVRLCQAITGSCPKMSSYDLADHVVNLLGKDKYFVILDEAQHLSFPGMEQVKYLWERSRFGGLLVGDTDLRKVLAKSPQLQSRVALGTEFELLTGDALHEVVRTFHPALATAPRAALTRLERARGGNLRNWRVVAEVLDHLTDRTQMPPDLSDHRLLEAVVAEFA
jgi:DNA transposition AAA+ family ATPase